MNILTALAEIEQNAEDHNLYLWMKLLVDNEPLVDLDRYGLAIDWAELAATLKEAGEFFIITCTCRDPGCAGIREGIRVYRDNKNVHWVVRGFWGPTRALVFEHEAYAEAIERGIKEFRKLRERHPGVQTSPFGI